MFKIKTQNATTTTRPIRITSYNQNDAGPTRYNAGTAICTGDMKV